MKIDTEPAGTSPAQNGRPSPTIGTAVGLFTLAWAAGLASFSLTDNSFFTHLATGRIILDTGAVPSTDPYSFTAAGADWTVQSWLMSVLYASAERLGGTAGLRVLLLVMFLGAGALVWRLSRPCSSVVPRIALLLVTMIIVTTLWGERPYMIGVLGIGLVWLALDSAVPPWAMVPIFWVWANSHGSFPLGLGLIVLVLIGRRLDGEDLDATKRLLAWSVAGTLSAMIGPLGPKAILFPLTALSKADVLSQIVEWQPPTYESLDQRLFLVLVAATLLALMRRPTWALAIPAVAFIIAAQLAQRNLALAVMVLVPVAATSIGDVGTLRMDDRPSLIRAYVGFAALALIGGMVYAVTAPFGPLDGYPADALAWVETRTDGEEDLRVATPDTVGNLLEALDGPQASVFFDDRVDMYPVAIVDDSLDLQRGKATWDRVLDKHEIDLVVWERSRPLGSLLAADAAWRVAYSDSDWIVVCRRASSCAQVD